MVLALLPAAALAAVEHKVELKIQGENPQYFNTLADAFKEAPVNEFTVTVLENTQETETAIAKSGKNITLYLNGKTVTGNGNGAVIRVRENATLTIYDKQQEDAESASKGTITGGTGYHPDNYTYGGGIYVASGGTLKMYDGTITGNTAQNGGGVHVDDGGTFEMHGGEISGNIATGNSSAGGGVYVKGKFKLYGGKIINNKAVNSSSGGGVYVRKENSAQFFVDPAGPIVITGNTGPKNSKNNVYLYGYENTSKKIDILSSSDAGAVPLIGVSMGLPGVFTSGLGLTSETKEALLGIFFSDDDAFGVTMGGTEAKLDYAPVIIVPAEDQTVSLTYGKAGTLSVSAFLNHVGGSLVYQWYSIGENAADPVTEADENNSTYKIAGDTAAGTYKYYCAVTNKGNGVTAVSKTFTVTIAKADPTANAPTGLYAVYGDTLADVTLTNPEGNTPGTWAWADSALSVGNVVTPAATFKATFTPDSSNYKTVENVEVAVTVNKAPNPATVTDRVSVKLGGNTVDLAANVQLNGATGDVAYAISGDTLGCTLSGSVLTSGNTVGTVTVNVTVADDSNYNALAATPITVYITEKDTQTITAADVYAVYGDTDKSVAATTDGNGAISYAVKKGSEDYIAVDAATGALTIKKVPADGRAYVTVTAAETLDYALATKDVPITISPASITITVTGDQKTFTYDGEVHAAEGYTITCDAELFDAGKVSYTGSAYVTGTDAGTYPMGLQTANFTYTDTSVIATFSVIDGALTINAQPSYSGGGSAPTTYKINLPAETAGGKLIVSPERAAEGTKVTITAKPDEGYKAETPVVKDKNGKEFPVTQNADGTWSFIMPDGEVTVTGTFVEDKAPETGEKFVDVPKDAWYHDDVYWAVDKGITLGVDDTHFAPNAACTRAQFVTFLWRAAGEPAPTSAVNPFEDVKADAYYYEAVLWAVENGVTKGTDDTHFSPDKSVTRAEAMTFLYRYEQTLGKGFTGLWAFQLDFADAADVPDWAYEAFCWMVKEDICKGADGKLEPAALCLRCQVVALLARCFR